jgi:hypothetical protein
MFGQLLSAPLGNALILEEFVAPSTVELRRVFPTMVCVKTFGEELGPGNEPCGGWNQPLIFETPNLESPVGNKCSCHEWEELIPEFLADFDQVHKLDGGRMEVAREATAVRATGEAKAIRALVASHNKFGKVLTELQLFLLSQNRRAYKRIFGGGKHRNVVCVSASKNHRAAGNAPMDLRFFVLRSPCHVGGGREAGMHSNTRVNGFLGTQSEDIHTGA